MSEFKKQILDYIDAHANDFIGVSDAIWEYAELSLKEFKSAALYCKVLRENGFAVEEGLCGVQTAFSGSFGSGKPVIGILGEFDALSGLSQTGGVAEKMPQLPGGGGHGCGHNLLGAGSLAAAFAVKDYLEKTGKSGTVIYFGCPGEEGGAGKAFMAREGAWKKLDVAITWHPADVNRVVSGSCLSCIQKEYTFHGIASHAAGDPERGRSALDAVELLNIGVQYLREHMPQTARVHYAITDGGGLSPNVVQPTASVLYMVRDHLVGEALKLEKRVDKIAEAAAMMTETEVSVRFIDGCANTLANKALEELMYRNFAEVPVPEYTAEELDYAEALVKSYESGPPRPLAQIYANEFGDNEIALINEKTDGGKKVINNFLMPYKFSKTVEMGSTDVGDVSWQTPTVQIDAACQPNGSPGHSWQNVSCGKSSIGYKGMLYAAKALAFLAADILEDPSLLDAPRAEFEKTVKAAGGYDCPIPPDAVPTAL